MPVHETIKLTMKNSHVLKLTKTIEDVYFVYYGKNEIGNDLNKDDMEYLFELVNGGYDSESKFKTGE